MVELEASLRRALAEVGAAAATQPADAGVEQTARMEESARRSVELADRLRIKVVDLEASLQTVVSEMNEAAAAQIRADEAETALAAAEEARALTMADTDRAADAEGRLGELEERLAAWTTRIAALSTSLRPDRDGTVVDIRDAEARSRRTTTPRRMRGSCSRRPHSRARSRPRPHAGPTGARRSASGSASILAPSCDRKEPP